MRVRQIFHLWLPLAVSFELMMLEGPAVQGAMGRLPGAPLNLAAWGLTMSLSLLVESPIIMLLATAIALVKDWDSFYALRRFTLNVIGFCTAMTFLVAFTPIFDIVARNLMGQPAAIVDAARPAMRIMLFWTAAIGWRRFYQGTLVGHGYTRLVSVGTAIRLAATLISAVGLVAWGGVPGVQVGAISLMIAVVTEAIVTTIFASPIVKRDVIPAPRDSDIGLTQKAILQFHAPLAATTLLTLLANPITSAALARLDHPSDTLAAAPVVFMVLLVMRGWGLALQEISVAQARKPEAHGALTRFTWMVGIITSTATGSIVFTPLLGLYLGGVIHLPIHLWSIARTGIAIGFLLPLITALGSWARGVLVASGATRAVYQGMAINLTTHAGMLMIGVLLRMPGMWVASGAFTLAAVVEYAYLVQRLHQVRPVSDPPDRLNGPVQSQREDAELPREPVPVE